MTQSSSRALYGWPPQDGQSGEADGKPGPKKGLKQAFDAAFNAALTADTQALIEAKPVKVIDAVVRELMLGALDGRASAQRLVLERLDQAEVECLADIAADFGSAQLP